MDLLPDCTPEDGGRIGLFLDGGTGNESSASGAARLTTIGSK